MTQPMISVVVPSRCGHQRGGGDPSRLLVSLSSYLSQTIASDNFEIIIVDDASEMRLDDLVYRALPSRLPVRVERSEQRLGLAGAMNLGVELAKSEIVLLGIDDNIAESSCLESHLAAHKLATYETYVTGIERFAKHTYVLRDVITGEYEDANDEHLRRMAASVGANDLISAGQFFGVHRLVADMIHPERNFALFWNLSAGLLDELYEELSGEDDEFHWFCVRLGNHSIKRSTYIRLGGLDTKLPLSGGQTDLDLGLRLQAAAIPVVVAPDARMVHLPHRIDGETIVERDKALVVLAEKWPLLAVKELPHLFGPPRLSLAKYKTHVREQTQLMKWT